MPVGPLARRRNYSRFATSARRVLRSRRAWSSLYQVTARRAPPIAIRDGSCRETRVRRSGLVHHNERDFEQPVTAPWSPPNSCRRCWRSCWIDIVLAGDNAIVIALAARQLPAHLQRRAIAWGAVGAVGVRIVLTAAVVWLLQIPGLLAIGGALLVWIAWKLLIPEESAADDPHAPVVTGFWSAMRTVIVADALMGLDNVLAVAGASHGNLLLVVLGLAISVPIVMWAARSCSRSSNGGPRWLYLGAGVLVWTGVVMVRGEPFVKAWLADHPAATALGYALVPCGAAGRVRAQPPAASIRASAPGSSAAGRPAATRRSRTQRRRA